MALIECPECGKEVSPSALACPNCGYGVKKHFDDIENAKREEERKAKLALQRAKRNKTLKVVLPIIIVVLIVITGIVINSKVLSERTLFYDNETMLDYLTKWGSWELDNDYREEYLAFYDEGLCSLLTDGIMNGGEKIVLHPKRGYFERSGDKYFISSAGDIVSADKKDYYKPRASRSPMEDGYKALNIEILSSKAADGSFEAEYKITNNGTKSYRQVFLETTITLSDGNKIVLDDFEYVAPDDEEDYYLRPGKTGTTKAFGKNIPSTAEEFSAHVKSYGTEYKFN